jgi:cytochrome b561
MKAELNPIRKLLHWIIAIMVIAMIPAGLIFTNFDNKPAIESLFGEGSFDQFFNMHKSIGLTVLALMGVRILAMLLWPAPEHSPPLGFFARFFGKATHGALYALLVLVPVLGWMGVSAFPAPLPVFGLFDAPPIAPENREMSKYVLWLHGLGAFAIAALVIVHVSAGVWHRSVRRDTVFNRVSFGPGRKQRRAAAETPAE